MKFDAIHHIAIICTNYEISKKFYTEILGLAVIEETYRKERNSYKLDLRINAQSQIELFSFPNPPKRPSQPEAAGLRHIAFHVGNVDEVKKYLESKHVYTEEIRIDPITQKRFFFSKDPDDLPIEFYER